MNLAVCWHNVLLAMGLVVGAPIIGAVVALVCCIGGLAMLLELAHEALTSESDG
jgi:hypothetical protein